MIVIVRLSALLLLSALCARLAPAQNAVAMGRETFESRCAVCHGADGLGGELGPAIVERVPTLPDSQIESTVHLGLPGRGMPANDVSDAEMSPLIAFLRNLRPRPPGFAEYTLDAKLADGKTLHGAVLAEGYDDLQLRSADQRLHLLRRAAQGKFREVTSEVDWSGYNGNAGGNRYSQLQQINKSNLGRLAPRWVFQMPNASALEVTPVVVAGVMYVTRANECYALDAGSGRPIWHFSRPLTRALIGNAASGINRGVAVARGRVYMVTDNAHLLALDASHGSVVWEIELADWRQNYNATSAPLLVGDLVITGTAGGEEGVRGFVAAYSQDTGREVWRFWTVPAPGEQGSETWRGAGIEHGGATTWMTGTYDASTDTVFWTTGNPGQDYNGDERGGDNLYADCILALDATSGRLKWFYQTTPHDVWDWDAAETPLVIDGSWHGQPRKLLAQGNRNGYFYVLDRLTGQLLLAKQFVRELTWASGIGADGRPLLLAGQVPGNSDTRVCPSQSGATNWFSPSFSPETGLFYMQTAERCSLYRKRRDEFAAGRPFLGGVVKIDTNPKPTKILRALDLQTGTVRWELAQVGSSNSAGGTLTTATGLVFYGDDSGAFAPADAKTGAALWARDLSVNWRASPMAYQFDGSEYIGIAAGGSVIAFGLSK